MRLYTQGLTYPQACQLQADLRRKGIDSNIVTGALAINALKDFPGGVRRWDDWSEDEKLRWLNSVFEVVGDRCPLSSETPLLQRLILKNVREKADKAKRNC